MSKFSNRFKQLKDERKLTLKQLSDELNITIPNLSYYMKGREPNYDTLISIANFFDVSTDWLIGRSDSRTTTYAALQDEIFNKYAERDKISKEDLSPLTVYENCYLNTQNTIVEFLCYFYSLLGNLETLEQLHSDLDFSTIEDDLTYNLQEALQYQIDFVNEANMLMLDDNTDNIFKYCSNSLSRIDLLSQRYKLFVVNILKCAVLNLNETPDKLEVIANFIKCIESYGQNNIDNIELPNFFKDLGLL